MRAAISFLLFSLIAALLLEVAIRAAFPPKQFLDPSTDAFWLAREKQPAANPDTEPDPELGWRMRPNYRSELANHDEQGFRFTTQGDGPRALVVGDSFSYGLGVADHETYASQLGFESV